MAKLTDSDGEMFSKRPDSRGDSGRIADGLDDDPHLSGIANFMEAAIAAGMIIAHADGEASIPEHRRIINLLKQHPVLRAFSVDDVAREIETHVIAFRADHGAAERAAETRLVHAYLTSAQFETIIGMCRSVVEADGISNPSEIAALVRVSSFRTTR